MSIFRSSLLGLTLLSLPIVGCADHDFDSAAGVGSVTAALTAEQCTYFGVDDRVTICHATSSARNPYVVIRTSTAGCAEGHAGHAGDYITSSDPLSPLYDPTCQGLGCFPAGAPWDGSVECCDGLAPNEFGVCADIDACENNPCGANATCADLPAPALDSPEGRVCECAEGFVGSGEVVPELGPRYFEISTFNDYIGTIWCDAHSPPISGCTNTPVGPFACNSSLKASYGKQSASGISNGVQWRIQETGFSLLPSLGGSTTNSSTWFDVSPFVRPDYRDAMHAGGADMTIEFDAVVGDLVFYMKENFCGSNCAVTSSWFFVGEETKAREFEVVSGNPRATNCPVGAACPTLQGLAVRIKNVNASSIELVHGTFDGMTMAWYVETTVPSDLCFPSEFCPVP